MTKTLAGALCRVQMELKKLQLLNVHSFTDSAESILFENKDRVLIRKGDAFLSGKCRAITEYKVYWNQTYEGDCFSLFPVRTDKGKVKFLELPTRRLIQSSAKIKCANRDGDIYIKDEKGQYWQYKRGLGYARMNVSMDRFYQSKLKLPTLKTFGMNLLHHTGLQPHRLTLLDEITNQRENLKQLSDIQEEGGGNFVTGLARTMSTIVRKTVNFGTDLFGIVAAETVKLTNETSSTVEGVGSSILGIFHFAGGISNFVLYILDLLIIGYLVYMRWRVPGQGREVEREIDK